MNKRASASSILTALAVLVTLFAGAGARAYAQQNPACCSYSVDVSGIDPACFPFRVLTNWGPGFQDVQVITANGVTTYPIAPPNFPPCPPAPGFRWASLDNGTTLAAWNFPATTWIGRCCYLTRIAFDQNGCTYIYVRPCP
ncbi:MAG TPA: hypothetical protein VHI13_04070 [Candidatus Kapabacteria bacterium]|nr:hypothetical protein [Candidatus Kapabacteria bacterium]